MLKNYINTQDFINVHFSELNIIVPPQAIHPNYTLDMHLPSNIKKALNHPINELQTYCKQLFGKFIALIEFELVPFIFYMLYKISARREWLESCLLLVANNKELFLKSCTIEKYFYLANILHELYDVNCTDSQSLLYEDCETCRHKFKQRVFHDLKMLKSFPPAERSFFLKRILISIKYFDKLRDLKFEDSLSETVDFEIFLNDHGIQLENDLKDQLENMENNAITSGEKIEVNCTAKEFGTFFGEFIKKSRSEDGGYLFDYDNTNLSKCIVKTFYFKIGNQIVAKSMCGYLPPLRLHN